MELHNFPIDHMQRAVKVADGGNYPVPTSERIERLERLREQRERSTPPADGWGPPGWISFTHGVEERLLVDALHAKWAYESGRRVIADPSMGLLFGQTLQLESTVFAAAQLRQLARLMPPHATVLLSEASMVERTGLRLFFDEQDSGETWVEIEKSAQRGVQWLFLPADDRLTLLAQDAFGQLDHEMSMRVHQVRRRYQPIFARCNPFTPPAWAQLSESFWDWRNSDPSKPTINSWVHSDRTIYDTALLVHEGAVLHLLSTE